jgi:hypothetical protein
MLVVDKKGNPIKETAFNTEIPVQRNHLTTIIGNVLTTATEVDVTIDDNFANADSQNWVFEAFVNGGEVTLDQDYTIGSTLFVEPGAEVVLNLNGKKIKNTKDNQLTDVIVVKEGGKLTINGNGTIEAVDGNDGYAVICEGELVINGGTYKSGVDANGEPNAVIYARGNGKVFINGGYFPNDNASKFVVNKKDADRATTEISIAGGTFGAFNPGDNAAEGPATNFLKAGFMAVANGDEFVVMQGEADAPASFVNSADELQAALDAATESVTLVLGADVEGNVTVTQKAGINVTIDGNGQAFDGTLTINGQSKVGTGETLVIKNVNFATEATAAMDFISSATDAVRYAENVTIEGCTFTAPEATDVVAIRIRQGYDIVVKNCEMKGGHSLAQVTSSNNIDFVGCTVESGRGINLQNALTGVANITNCNIKATKADGYGIRVDAKGANVMNVTGCTIDAFEAIVLRNAQAAYTLNLSGNTLSTDVVVLGETPVINK